LTVLRITPSFRYCICMCCKTKCLLRGTNWISIIIQVHCRIETVNSAILDDLSVSISRLLSKPVRSLGAPWFYNTHFVMDWANKHSYWTAMDTPWPCDNKWITEKMMDWEMETVWSPQITGRLRSSLLLGSNPSADRPVRCTHPLRVKVTLRMTDRHRVIAVEILQNYVLKPRFLLRVYQICCSFSASMNAVTSVARRLAIVLERVTLISHTYLWFNLF